jgi:hypothetical protein
VALAVLVAGQAFANAGTAPACMPLCGAWVLDTTESTDLNATLDKAMAQYKAPRARRMHEARGSSIESMARAADEETLGPIQDRPGATALRHELEQTLHPAHHLALDANEHDILIRRDDAMPLIFSPGEPHARVDDLGTARIRTTWQDRQLVVTEVYERSRQLRRSYALQRKTDTLVVTQLVTRPGLPVTTLRSVYRRNNQAGLTSTRN